MSVGVQDVIQLAMLLGLAGVLVPGLPGLLLIEAATLGWVVTQDGPGRWVVLALVSAVLGAGTVAKYVVPGRSLRGAGAPWSTVATGAAASVAGFFLLPGVGLLLGGVGGIYAAETLRLRDARAARASTWTTLRSVGVGMALELAAGVTAVAVWALGAALTT